MSKICLYCSESHEKKGKYCSDSCKMKDYRRRNSTVTENGQSVTVEANRSVTVDDMFESLPFDVKIQINSIFKDEQDWQLRVGRAYHYQQIFSDRPNTGTICSCKKCQAKNAEFSVKPEFIQE